MLQVPIISLSFPSLQKDDVVYFLDYTGPPGFPEECAQRASQVVVLDHHKTAQETLVGRDSLPENLSVHIDMERSGATIARDHFDSIQVWRCDTKVLAQP